MTRTDAPLGGLEPVAEGGVVLPKPPGVIRQFWARHPRLTDALITAVYAVPTAIGSIAISFTPEPPAWWLTAVHLFGVVVAGTTLLLARRTNPWLVFAVGWAVCVIVSPFAADALPVLFALYALGVYRSTKDAWIGFGVSLVLSSGVAYVPMLLGRGTFVPRPIFEGDPVATITQYTVTMLIATLLGVTVGNRRRYLDALIARAHDLARERDQQARLATAAERSRIAREMHDIVSHGLTVMIALAEGSAAAAPRDPGGAADMMRGVAETGREALGDMRRMLGVLNDPDVPAERHPQPDAAELPALVDGFREAGLPVRLTTTGVPPGDPSLGLTVYRIVQEGLTNTLRHAARPSLVDVAVTYRDDVVDVIVEDDARAPVDAPATTGAGRGLPGVRERAGLYGGDVEAGARPGGGWRLHATLRLGDQRARPAQANDLRTDDGNDRT